MRRLEARAFGDVFPGEHQLATEYDVSRHTVREALRRLRQGGVLDSGRGHRTAVRTARIEQPLGALYSLFSEVQARGMHQRSEVITRRTRQDPAVAARMGIDADTEFVYLERLRYADEQPLALDCTWLLASLARPLLVADLTATGVYVELARLGTRITSGQEHIHAIMPTADQRRLLGLGRRVALLAIDRIGCVNGAPTEWRETLVRGDRFSVVAKWTPHTPYQMAVAADSPLDSSARPGRIPPRV